MRVFPILLLLFLAVPILEIYLLITVGGIIGVGWTIFAVVFTAVLGAFLVRAQGFSTINKIRGQLDHGELPAMELLEGLFLLVAGALLLTPGFFTDAIGFACLTPPLRRGIIRLVLKRGVLRSVNVRTSGVSTKSGGDRSTLEGEYRRVDDD